MELGGMKGVRLKDITYGTYVKSHYATQKRVGLPKTQSGTDTHQWEVRSRRKLIKKQQHYWNGNMPESWISQSRRKETRIRV